MANKRKQVINGFQGLREFAIILIVISHCTWKENIYGNNILTWAGAWGVSIFLMISGFLAVEKNWNVTLSLRKVGELVRHKVGKYYGLYFFMFLVSIPLVVRKRRIFVVIINAIINMLQLETLFPKSGIYFAFNAVSWYLSLDLLLTLFLPGILFFLRKMNRQGIKISILVIWIIQLAIVVFSYKFNNPHWITYISPYTRWMDYFVGGGIAILCKENKTDKSVYLNVGCVVIGFIVLLSSFYSNSELFSAWTWTLINAGLLFSTYQLESRKTMWNFGGLIYIGNISFEIFLIHQLVIRYGTWGINHFGIQINYVINIGFIFVAFIISEVFHRIRKRKGKRSVQT